MKPTNNYYISNLVDLGSSENGAVVIDFSDDFLGKAENILGKGRGIWQEDLYDEKGKVYDGWGSKRNRDINNQDWVIIKLAVPGIINIIDIDTNHFKHNSPLFASIDGGFIETDEIFNDEEMKWETLLNSTYISPDTQNLYHIKSNSVINIIKLKIYPDGGLARLKIYGTPNLDNKLESKDYASELNGGKVIYATETYYGKMENLIKNYIPSNANDGWGTMRRRRGSYDYVIIKLGKQIELEEILINTQHFIGNFPEYCNIEGINKNKFDNYETYKHKKWIELRKEYKLFSGHEHRITQFENDGKYTHIKISIYPDGGISRIKVIGK